MGIFDKIKSAIWGGGEDEAKPTVQPTGNVAVASASTASPSAPKPAAAPAAAPASAPAASAVDVAAVLDEAVRKNGQKLNWRTSIVDLMKALDLDSSLASRKELASELGYTGSTSNSAAMNMWLHKQVIQKLKDNGGKVPSDLL